MKCATNENIFCPFKLLSECRDTNKVEKAVEKSDVMRKQPNYCFGAYNSTGDDDKGALQQLAKLLHNSFSLLLIHEPWGCVISFLHCGRTLPWLRRIRIAVDWWRTNSTEV
jgi:hypothetical protein